MGADSDIKSIKSALYILIKEKYDHDMYKAKHVEKYGYDGCGCSVSHREVDSQQVEAVNKKYQSLLRALKRGT